MVPLRGTDGLLGISAPSRPITEEVWPSGSFLGFPMCSTGPWIQSPCSSGCHFPRPRHSLSGLGREQWSQTPKSNVFFMVGLMHKKFSTCHSVQFTWRLVSSLPLQIYPPGHPSQSFSMEVLGEADRLWITAFGLPSEVDAFRCSSQRTRSLFPTVWALSPCWCDPPPQGYQLE